MVIHQSTELRVRHRNASRYSNHLRDATHHICFVMVTTSINFHQRNNVPNKCPPINEKLWMRKRILIWIDESSKFNSIWPLFIPDNIITLSALNNPPRITLNTTNIISSFD